MQAVMDKHIELTPGVRGGRPRIAGTRLAVADIVMLHLRMGKSLEEIAGKYQVTLGDVYAAMAYYYDHRGEIDADMAADEEYGDQYARTHPSRLRAKLDALNNGD
jgi:uncharacterized protein (DUF433 family)